MGATSQEQRFRYVLLQLEMLSSGSTQAWNSSGSPGGEPDDRMVALVAAQPKSKAHPDQPAHLRYRVLWGRCESDAEREQLIDQAMQECAAFRVRGSGPVESKSDREILTENILGAKGWSDEEVAQRWRCTIREVRRVRIAAGVDDRGIGRVIEGDQVERARGMAAAGMTERAIALALGLNSASRVRQLLGKAA